MNSNLTVDIDALGDMVPANLLLGRNVGSTYQAETDALAEYDSLSWSQVHHEDRAWGDTTPVLTVNLTAWGDYGGSTVERSNCRVLLAEYPDHVKEVTGSIGGGSTLVVPLDQAIPKELYQSLVYISEDYPVLDDSDHQELEDEVVQECWELFGKHDFSVALGDAFAAKFQEDGWAEPVSEEVARAMVEAMDVTSAYYDAIYDTNDYPHCDAATSAVFPDLEHVAKRVADQYINRLELHPDQGSLDI